MKFDRATRRHHVARLKKNRKYYWGYDLNHYFENHRVMGPKELGKVVQYPASCSCQGCRNPRRSNYYSAWGKLTIQEQRFYQETNK